MPTLKDLQKRISNRAAETVNPEAYRAGFYCSMVEYLVSIMPEQEQERYINTMVEGLEELAARESKITEVL